MPFCTQITPIAQEASCTLFEAPLTSISEAPLVPTRFINACAEGHLRLKSALMELCRAGKEEERGEVARQG